ncbi:hypothetical protein [Bradyrhizobium sp. 5.13L]
MEHVKGQVAFVQRAPDEEPPKVGISDYSPIFGRDVDICYMRPIADELCLDRKGFTLIPRRVTWPDESDPDVMRDGYLEEMVPSIKDYFNASWNAPKREAVIVRSASAGLAVGRGTSRWCVIRGALMRRSTILALIPMQSPARASNVGSRLPRLSGRNRDEYSRERLGGVPEYEAEAVP